MTPLAQRIADLVDPLDGFYAEAGRALPAFEVVEPAEMPAIYRELLVHDRDMTSTLEAYCGDRVHLRVLRVHETPGEFLRQVVLVTDRDERAIEFGAIRIHLGALPLAARDRVREGHRPLGTILKEDGIANRSRPTGYFRIDGDAGTRALFANGSGGVIDATRPLFGRHNHLVVLRDRAEVPLAEVVEILPPLPEAEGEEDAR